MAHSGEYTYQEIVSQPESWVKSWQRVCEQGEAIASLWGERPWAQVVFTGCGSTYYLSLAAEALFRELTGRLARGYPASELWLNARAAYPRQGALLLVPVSRSGETTETLRAVQIFRDQAQGRVIAITCCEGSALYRMGDLGIGLPWAQEQSIAQTRSFASMYVAAAALGTICAARQDLLEAMGKLGAIGDGLIIKGRELARELGRDSRFERFYFLGSGARYGLACEASLKMKEMSLSHAEPFHFLEFRHGPKSMVNAQTLVVGLLSEAQREPEQAVLREMRELGATILALCEQEVSVADYAVTFSSGLPEEIRGVLYLPVLQLLAYEHALSKGLDPDKPTHLDAVVRLGDV